MRTNLDGLGNFGSSQEAHRHGLLPHLKNEKKQAKKLIMIENLEPVDTKKKNI